MRRWINAVVVPIAVIGALAASVDTLHKPPLALSTRNVIGQCLSIEAGLDIGILDYGLPWNDFRKRPVSIRVRIEQH